MKELLFYIQKDFYHNNNIEIKFVFVDHQWLSDYYLKENVIK